MNKKFLSMRKIANCEKGALLLGIIVTIVIFAVLGVTMLSITSTSTFTQVYGNDATKAYYMAESGYRYASIGIVTIGKGDDNCLKCHSSHGKDTIRSSAADTKLSDDTIKVHGKPYPDPADPDLLDGGAFTVRLAPYWFEAESLDEVGTGFDLTVSAVAHSIGDPQCDFPEEFTDGTIIGGGLYVGGEYVSYSNIVPGDGTLTFTGVGNIPLQEDGVFFDVIPACIIAKEQKLNSGGDLEINGAAAGFPNTKGVIEIYSTHDNPGMHLVTYESVDADIGQFIGLGNVDEDVFGSAGLSVNEDDIVTLSKTLKVTSTGRYADAEKTLAYYRWVGQPLTVPIVYNTAEPDEDKLLAGGNFHWVEYVNDNRGHNIFQDNGDNILNKAPGDMAFASCGGNDTSGNPTSCHANLHRPVEGWPSEFIGRSDCKVCHFDPHPLDEGDDIWYRFVSIDHSIGGSDPDIILGAGGAEGIEHEKWNYDATLGSHNEYPGKEQNDSYGFGGGLGNTTTAYCTGCHGKFHEKQKDDDDKWIYHPSDCVIKNEGEYASAFGGVYDPDVPVARPSLDGWITSNNIVTPGSDMVMCLSCHYSHGSKYPDMLRWDYDEMIVGTQGAGKGKGCFKCHTDKDDNAAYFTAGGGKSCYECHTMHDSQDNVCATPTLSPILVCDGAYPHLLNGVYVCPHPKP